MRNIKETLGKIAFYTLLVSPTIIPLGVMYSTGFPQAYNEALQRRSTFAEEVKFRQDVLKEVGKLKAEGKNLGEIVSWLKEK